MLFQMGGSSADWHGLTKSMTTDLVGEGDVLLGLTSISCTDSVKDSGKDAILASDTESIFEGNLDYDDTDQSIEVYILM